MENGGGAAGANGRGEANIRRDGSRIVVENMRHGMAPEEACMDVLRRICAQTKEKRLLRETGYAGLPATVLRAQQIRRPRRRLRR